MASLVRCAPYWASLLPRAPYWASLATHATYWASQNCHLWQTHANKLGTSAPLWASPVTLAPYWASLVKLAPYWASMSYILQLRPQKITYSSNEWVNGVEQSLMVLLILGRWLLPKGDLSHEQVSQVKHSGHRRLIWILFKVNTKVVCVWGIELFPLCRELKLYRNGNSAKFFLVCWQ